MNSIHDAAVFYDKNYRVACNWTLRAGEKVILGRKENQRCRFCGEQAPIVSFRKDAHAIPESIGNKSLYSLYECDSCNDFFGSGIENDFGNWSKPMRALTRRKGKNGVPTLKGGGSLGWKIEYAGTDNQFNFTVGSGESSAPLTADIEGKRISIKVKRDPHIPMAVLKTFVKMALSIMPEPEMVNFRKALEWIMNPIHEEEIPILAPVSSAFTPGPEPTDKIVIAVLCRKEDCAIAVPYAFLILAYGNEMFQVMIPSPERDQFEDTPVTSLSPFPKPPSAFGEHVYDSIDLCGTEIVKDAEILSEMQFESAIRSDDQN